MHFSSRVDPSSFSSFFEAKMTAVSVASPAPTTIPVSKLLSVGTFIFGYGDHYVTWSADLEAQLQIDQVQVVDPTWITKWTYRLARATAFSLFVAWPR
jgi:hypothetical protein